MAQQAYRQGWGMLNKRTSRVHRPDWHYAVVAMARANLWRKLRQVGEKTDRWPLAIDVDNAWYSSPHEDPDDAVSELQWPHPTTGEPTGIVFADKLGAFSHKGSKRLPGAEAAGVTVTVGGAA
jgi:hypothetical protein